MKKVELGTYVVSDPSICHGKLTFKGTRVLVEPVLAAFANGETIDDIVTKDWPTITKEGVEEALMLAIHALVKDYPGYPDQPWHDEVARQVEEQEKRLKEVFVMKKVELGKYVVSDPSICHGKLTFKGTRVLVEPVLAAFANGKTIDDIVTKSWPTITQEAVDEALMLAIHGLVKDYPGYPDQPWHDEVARQVEEREKRLKERKRSAKERTVEVAS